ncbi:hypothetical protein Tco_0730282 [Tanacetum coccineum]|uniref:Reverse transcriptase domain-containing protein n=1 Tax=Tanacetum coccineum TaxID=301880 RepID=A0ABQ4YTT1_9ASTR
MADVAHCVWWIGRMTAANDEHAIFFKPNQFAFPNPEKSLQFRQVEESESNNLFHDHIQGEDENAEDVQMADHLRLMEELRRIPIVGVEDTIIVPAVLADQFELKTELLDFVPHDVVKLILFSFSLKGVAETWLKNEPPNSITSSDDLLMQNQMGQLAEDFQERPLGVLPSNTIMDPLAELNVITIESPSLLPNPFGDSDSLVEETDTLLSHFNDSSPDYETFCFDIEEKSNGNTTPHSDHSLPNYEAFSFDVDHIKEKSNGSTISHFDLSLIEYESFHFDISIDPLPPSNRSDSHHGEFADELAHIISPSEYDRFYFDIEPDLGELTILCEENIPKDSTKEPTSLELNDFPLLLSDCDSSLSKEFSEIDLLVSFPSRNENKIFDLRIIIIKGV